MANQTRLCRRKNPSGGFTLVEMVTVIVLLGVLSVGISKFLSIGSTIFVDVSNRDEIIASARFAVERLNRELRNALPNSVRVTTVGSKQCLEYTPIITSTIYLDIPVAPEPAATPMKVIEFDKSNLGTNYVVAVYPLTTNEVYDPSENKKLTLNNAGTVDEGSHQWKITYTNNTILFAEDSPTNRLYFIDQPVSFCVQGTQLTRHTGYGYTNGMANNVGVPMAGDINTDEGFPFQVTAPTQRRNATVLAKFKFSRNLEDVIFNNEIQVPNVP